jgi:hypothetical protein
MTKKAKAKAKVKAKTKKTEGQSAEKPDKPADLAPVNLAVVRKDITNIVGNEATTLTRAVMAEGRKGQLAPVKYLFEVAGLYPASEESQTKPEEASLARTLLHRLGLPEDPVSTSEDVAPMKLNLAVDRATKTAEAAEKESDEQDLRADKQRETKRNDEAEAADEESESANGSGEKGDDGVTVPVGSMP